MRAHIATESRHRDSTATAAGPESRRAYQPSEPATAMMQSRRQPFRLSIMVRIYSGRAVESC